MVRRVAVALAAMLVFPISVLSAGWFGYIRGVILTDQKRGLQGAVVTLEGGGESLKTSPVVASRTARVTVKDADGRFAPPLLVIPVGATVTFQSGDGRPHTVQGLTRSGQELFHLGLPATGRAASYTFTEPGIIALKDRLTSSGEEAYIVVAPTSHFAISDGEGRFTITAVPAGTYTLHIWHKELGSRSFPVRVEESQEIRITLTLEKPRIVKTSVGSAN